MPGFRSDGFSVDFIVQYKEWKQLSKKQLEKDLERKEKELSTLRKDNLKFTDEQENPTRGIHSCSAIKDLDNYCPIGIDPGIDIVMCWSKGKNSRPR